MERSGVLTRYKPIWAYVVYELDNEKDFVKITDIKGFYPRDQRDFDRNKKLQVLYRPKKGIATDILEYFNARVLQLGLTKESLMKEVETKRVPTPKIPVEDREELSFEGVEESPKAVSLKTYEQKVRKDAKQSKKDKEKAKHTANTASIIAAKMKAKKRKESSSSDEEIMLNKSEFKRFKYDLNQLEKRLKTVEKKLEVVERKIPESVSGQEEAKKPAFKKETPAMQEHKIQLFEDSYYVGDDDSASTVTDVATTSSNVAPADQVLSVTNVAPADQVLSAVNNVVPADQVISANSVAPDKKMTVANPVANSENDFSDFQVPTLNEIQEAKLKILTSNNSLWVKQLTGFVFPPEILIQCSFDGKTCNRNKEGPMKELPSTGKAFILNMYHQKLTGGGCADSSVLCSIERNVKSWVNEKCSAARRIAKTKLERAVLGEIPVSSKSTPNK